jgi:carboxypeptidase C (cathepsin A)
VGATAAPLSFVNLPKGVAVKSERTVLSSFQENGIWRVRIEWPNGSVHHFGSFTSEKDALQWIGDHAWLTIPVTKNKSVPHGADQPSSTDSREQQKTRA